MYEYKVRRSIGAKLSAAVVALGLVSVLAAAPAVAADVTAVRERVATNAEPIAVTPERADITDAKCVGDELTAPTITFPDNPGIVYSFSPEGPYQAADWVEVTATLTEGYVWAETLLGDWEKTSETEAENIFAFSEAECESWERFTYAAPPTITQAQCVDGEPTAPTMRIFRNGKVRYSVDNDAVYEAGQTVVVTATVVDGYEFLEEDVNVGWVWVSASEQTLTVTFDEVSCEPDATPSPASEQPAELAATGPAGPAVLGVAALFSALAGGVLIVVRRRVAGR